MKIKKELWQLYFEKELREKFHHGIEVEYRCNSCGRYFYSSEEGVSYPRCPYCGSTDVWDF